MKDSNLVLEHDEDVARLARTLERVRSLRLAMRNEAAEEAWAIAIGLRDIERSTQKLFAQLVPALLSAADEEKVGELLGNVGEEYRHILYHLTHSRYFEHLRDSVEE